jgi:Acetoacetate decarboxylase (ADC)
MFYVNQIGDTQNPPPYTFPDVSISSFRPEVDLDPLTALCDDILNIGDPDDRGFEFRPIFPFVDLEVLHYPKMEYGFFPPAGYISQNECYVRLFVKKYIGRHGWLWPDEEVAVFCPFLIVDNPWSAFAGRDVLGFPKLLEKFTPFSATSPFHQRHHGGISRPLQGGKGHGRTRRQDRAGAKGRQGNQGSRPKVALGGGRGPPDARHRTGSAGAARFHPGDFRMRPDEAVSGRDAPVQRLLSGDPAIVHLHRSQRRSHGPAACAGDAQRYGSINLAERLGLPTGQPLTPISQYHIDCSFSFGEVITLFTNGSKSFWCL